MTRRYHIAVRGAVQGVGFRPFIYRLAVSLGLTGWVVNSSQGVFMEIEGEQEILDQFLLRIESDKPVNAFLQSLECSSLDPAGFDGFEIRTSASGGTAKALILPDIATCPDCLRELFDPADRRYHYPFINCTHCGPRYTIIERLPYDRGNTTMNIFPMCPACRAEYDDPSHRRFHAEPIACWECGPALELCDREGILIAARDGAVGAACDAIRAGMIVAVKGVGGFHLLANATDDRAVMLLRQRKQREEKPFAVMFPSLEKVAELCEVAPLEERLLRSPESPIVLLRRLKSSVRPGQVSPFVAPGNPFLGVMVPYTPLHHLLMGNLAMPVVATSGNLSDEPICIDNGDALKRLGEIADLFLFHNRPIRRHVDDSVVRIVMGREYMLRRARGYAPLPVGIDIPNHRAVIAVGAHLKNAVALASDQNVFVSQHIGDLETPQSFDAFTTVIGDLSRMYEFTPALVVSDLHPDYLSTRYAAGLRIPREEVQHHIAHVASCMAENRIDGPLLGVSWDGTGYGSDGTVWGGEFFVTGDSDFRRIATFRQFRLIGGEQAVKEPRRTAIGLLYEIFGEDVFENEGFASIRACSPTERTIFRTMCRNQLRSPLTSSAGRLFDAVASLTGLRQITRFEGQAAMELEFAIGDADANESYPVSVSPPEGEMQIIDWSPMVTGLLADIAAAVPLHAISQKFHNTLAEYIIAVARRIGIERVVLTGGCFQNVYLLTHTVGRLREEKFQPYWHQRIPPNDGGIALGQIYASIRAHAAKKVQLSTSLTEK
jgi:hydrogenase maturation protein HypF